MESFVARARFIAAGCGNADKRAVLSRSCDCLEEALVALHNLPSTHNMITANAMWALTARVIDLIQHSARA